MKRTVFAGTISALALGAVILGAAVPASAFGAAGERAGQRAGMNLLQQADSDGDGALTQAEFDAFMSERFAQIDSDGDGTVTADELQAARPLAGMRGGEKGGMRFMRGRDGGHHFRAGGRHQMGEEVTPEMREARAQAMIARMDTDGDGLLSVEELSAEPSPQRLFGMLDTNGDGAISQEEFEAAREKFADRMPRGGFFNR